MFAENVFPSTIAQTRQGKVQLFWIDAATWRDYGYLSSWFEHLGYLKDIGIVAANVGNGSHRPNHTAAFSLETAALPAFADAAFRYRFPDLDKLWPRLRNKDGRYAAGNCDTPGLQIASLNENQRILSHKA